MAMKSTAVLNTGHLDALRNIISLSKFTLTISFTHTYFFKRLNLDIKYNRAKSALLHQFLMLWKATLSALILFMLIWTDCFISCRTDLEHASEEESLILEGDVGGGLVLQRKITIPSDNPNILRIASTIEARSVGAGSGGYSRFVCLLQAFLTLLQGYMTAAPVQV